MGGFIIPSAYRNGYAKVAALNPDLAALYIENTVFDDPLADYAVEPLAPLRLRDIECLMNAGLERDANGLAEAPKAVCDFFESIETPPAWFDRDSVLPDCHAFHEHPDLFIAGFIVVSLRNFDSLMSRVFFMTGRDRKYNPDPRNQIN